MARMRALHLYGVAGIAILAGQAAEAQTTVSTARTTPLITSSAGDVTVESGGSITLDSGVAVTIDSDNSVSNAGVLQIDDADDSAGIVARAGHTGDITNSSVILVDETTTTASDTDDDGDEDGAFVTGARRYGIHVTGPGSYTGTLSNASGGSISVEGEDAAGIWVEAALQGAILNEGSISAVGTRAMGVRLTGPIHGAVTLSGSVSATGDGALAALIEEEVAGRLTVQGSLIATGYRYTTRSTDTDFLAALDADDLLQGGSALEIRANLAGGLLVDIPPVTDDDDDDVDDDGVDDTSEGSGLIVTYGAAPALLIGSTGRDVALGDVGAGDQAYGLIVKGTISASGVYDGVAATAVQLGVPGGGRVTTGGGVSNSGTISALAYEADAVALRLNADAQAPVLVNSGTLSSTAVAERAVETTTILIESGASLPTILNSGSISAAILGEQANATAILDRSGTVTLIENIGAITASVTANDDELDTDDADEDETNETVTGKAVAIDLRANATGITLRQDAVADGDDGDDDVADADDDEDGVDDADESSIVGAILLGSGNDRLEILNGKIVGDIDFGAGANSLYIDGGATVTGAIETSTGDLALRIGSGSLRLSNAQTLNLSSLSLGGGSTVSFTIDPESGTQTRFDVSGAAEIVAGAKIDIALTSLLKTSASYTLIKAASLTSGAIDTSLLGDIPYLYSADLEIDATAGAITLALSRKTAGELQLPAAIASAYEPIIAAIDRDDDVRDAFLAQTDRTNLLNLYNRMLPNHSGSVFEALSAGQAAASRAVDDRGGADPGGIWIQEVATAVVRDDTSDSLGYKAWTIGLVGGAETAFGDTGAVGLKILGASTQIKDTNALGLETFTVSTLNVGGYWRLVSEGFTANAQVGGGYLRAKSLRGVYDTSDAGGAFEGREAHGRYSGWTVDARLAASYELRLGAAYARPTLTLDYLRVAEGDYQETGGGDAVDLSVDARTSSRATGFAGLALGAQFGDDQAWWSPEVVVGWRQIAGGALSDTTARFVSGGSDFTLTPSAAEGGAFVGRASIRGEVPGGAIVLEGGAELRDGLAAYDVRLAGHVRF